MKKREIERLIVGLSCGNFKPERITILIDIENRSIHFEFSRIGSDITKPVFNISLKGARPVRPVGFRAIDLFKITMSQRIDWVPTHIRLWKMIPGSVANGIGHHIASKFFHQSDEFNIVETSAINKYPGPFLH